MRKHKYVVGTIRPSGTFLDIDVALVFPESIPHNEMIHLFNDAPTSAGFFDLTENGVEVYGRSETLDLDPAPTDARLIEKCIGFKRPR